MIFLWLLALVAEATELSASARLQRPGGAGTGERAQQRAPGEENSVRLFGIRVREGKDRQAMPQHITGTCL